jgi:hypothetical protein
VRFTEKPAGDHNFINGGFFVLDPSVIGVIDGDATPWESGPLEQLAAKGELMAFRHAGFWHPMDTMRDCIQLENHWSSGNAPWKVWASLTLRCRIRHSGRTSGFCSPVIPYSKAVGPRFGSPLWARKSLVSRSRRIRSRRFSRSPLCGAT